MRLCVSIQLLYTNRSCKELQVFQCHRPTIPWFFSLHLFTLRWCLHLCWILAGAKVSSDWPKWKMLRFLIFGSWMMRVPCCFMFAKIFYSHKNFTKTVPCTQNCHESQIGRFLFFSLTFPSHQAQRSCGFPWLPCWWVPQLGLRSRPHVSSKDYFFPVSTALIQV